MSIISFLVVGALAGWIANKLMKSGQRYGLIGNMIIGVIGAVLGGAVVGLLGRSGVNGLNLWSILVSVLGAVLLLWIVKKVRK